MFEPNSPRLVSVRRRRRRSAARRHAAHHRQRRSAGRDRRGRHDSRPPRRQHRDLRARPRRRRARSASSTSTRKPAASARSTPRSTRSGACRAVREAWVVRAYLTAICSAPGCTRARRRVPPSNRLAVHVKDHRPVALDRRLRDPADACSPAPAPTVPLNSRGRLPERREARRSSTTTRSSRPSSTTAPGAMRASLPNWAELAIVTRMARAPERSSGSRDRVRRRARSAMSARAAIARVADQPAAAVARGVEPRGDVGVEADAGDVHEQASVESRPRRSAAARRASASASACSGRGSMPSSRARPLPDPAGMMPSGTSSKASATRPR